MGLSARLHTQADTAALAEPIDRRYCSAGVPVPDYAILNSLHGLSPVVGNRTPAAHLLFPHDPQQPSGLTQDMPLSATWQEQVRKEETRVLAESGACGQLQALSLAGAPGPGSALEEMHQLASGINAPIAQLAPHTPLRRPSSLMQATGSIGPRQLAQGLTADLLEAEQAYKDNVLAQCCDEPSLAARAAIAAVANEGGASDFIETRHQVQALANAQERSSARLHLRGRAVHSRRRRVQSSKTMARKDNATAPSMVQQPHGLQSGKGQGAASGSMAGEHDLGALDAAQVRTSGRPADDHSWAEREMPAEETSRTGSEPRHSTALLPFLLPLIPATAGAPLYLKTFCTSYHRGFELSESSR